MLDPPAPSTIVATIPEWLGRRPITGSAVLVGFSDADPERAVVFTLQPEAFPDEEVEAFSRLVVDGVEAVAIVRYTGAEPEPGRGRLGLPFLAACAERFAIDVLGVLVVVPTQRETPGYWRTLPDPTRHPLPPSADRQGGE